MAFIMDKKHFYKVDGDFIRIANEIAMAAENNELCEILIGAGKINEIMKNLHLEEIK